MKMPHATANPVNVVRNLLRRAVCHISDKSSLTVFTFLPFYLFTFLLFYLFTFLLFYHTILDADDAVCLCTHIGVMGHDNLGHVLFFVQLLQQLHHLDRGL